MVFFFRVSSFEKLGFETGFIQIQVSKLRLIFETKFRENQLSFESHKLSFETQEYPKLSFGEKTNFETVET